MKQKKGEKFMTIEQRIKEIREDKDIKQREIADFLNCKQNTYSQYESGKKQIPNEVIKKLCLYYNISADYILDLPKGLPYPKR